VHDTVYLIVVTRDMNVAVILFWFPASARPSSLSHPAAEDLPDRGALEPLARTGTGVLARDSGRRGTNFAIASDPGARKSPRSNLRNLAS